MTLKPLLPLVALAALPGCAVIPQPSTPVLPEGSAVALNQSVAGGGLVATPLEVVKDDRCPANVQCIRAGEVIVKTRISDGQQAATKDLTLGEAAEVLGYPVRLATVTPAKMTNATIAARDYRFTYELVN
tara:strand:+ start:9867 stop:10256 length:390 start_codon:yes stop_codon:yes gene_type:complete